MKRIFVLMAASAAFPCAVDPADGVREAAEGWRQGAIKQDGAALQRYLADELVYTHGNGKCQTKAEYIADVTKGPPHYESFTASGTNIRVYGKVAILCACRPLSAIVGQVWSGLPGGHDRFQAGMSSGAEETRRPESRRGRLKSPLHRSAMITS